MTGIRLKTIMVVQMAEVEAVDVDKVAAEDEAVAEGITTTTTEIIMLVGTIVTEDGIIPITTTTIQVTTTAILITTTTSICRRSPVGIVVDLDTSKIHALIHGVTNLEISKIHKILEEVNQTERRLTVKIMFRETVKDPDSRPKLGSSLGQWARSC